MGTCASAPADESKSYDKAELLSRDVKTSEFRNSPRNSMLIRPGEPVDNPELAQLSSREIVGRVVARTFFLMESLLYVLVTLVLLFAPGWLSEGFPLYLPADLVADKVAMDYLRVALVAVSLVGLGYLPMAVNNREAVFWASIFNKAAVGVHATVCYSMGIIPMGVLVLAMLSSVTVVITIINVVLYPSSIPADKRTLLWWTPASPNRTTRSYCFEFEGYLMTVFYLLLCLPVVSRAFAGAPAIAVDSQYPGVELTGYRFGMFQIVCFWMANVYWFYIPAGRTNSKSIMATGLQQRLLLLVLFVVVHFRDGDYEHNLFNTIAIWAFLFLTLDFYAVFFDRFFANNPEDDEEYGKFSTAEYALFHQESLNTMGRWVTLNAVGIVLLSMLWMWMATSGVPYLFHKVLPGYEDLAYKLHLSDYLIAIMMPLVAVIFSLLPKARHIQRLANVFTFVFPSAAWWWVMQSKILMHLGGGTPWHPSWVVLGLGTRWTEVTTDITFWMGTVSLKIVIVGLLAALVIYGLGSPLAAFTALDQCRDAKELAKPIKTIMVQQMTLLVIFSGLWMVLASSGLPMPAQALDDIAGVPPALKTDPRIAAAVHRYDLIGAFSLVIAGWMLADCTNNRFKSAQRVTRLLVYSMWTYAVAVKVSASVGATAAFHQEWVDDYGTPLYSNAFADVFSWIAFVLLNFIAYPIFFWTVSEHYSWEKLDAFNNFFARQTHQEILLWNRSMYFQHSLLMVTLAGLWALATSPGFVWPLESMASANIKPILPSFNPPNPAVAKVLMQDWLFAITQGVLAMFLDFVPVRLTGEREIINWGSRLIVMFTWSLSLWSKVMVNLSEDDMSTWPGTGAFGEWRNVAERETTHNLVDVVWYIVTILARTVTPLLMMYIARNAVGNVSQSLRAGRIVGREEDNELNLFALLLTLIGRRFERTSAYRFMSVLSRIVSPPERQFLTVDRIAYAMQEPSKTLRRKYFKEIGVGRDKYGWWYCNRVPEEIEDFQRNQILPAMAAHTIEKSPSTFIDIARARAFTASPAWMVWQPLTDQIFNDLFYNRFGAEILRKANKEELQEFDKLFSRGAEKLRETGNVAGSSGRTARSRLQGGMSGVGAKLAEHNEICVCDATKFLQGAERKSHTLYTPGFKIYFSATKYGIRARVIKFFHPDGTSTVYVNDASPDWHFAKRLVSTGLITMHQIGVHLAHGHLLAESQVVLAYKHLEPDHWLFNYVEPLAGDVQFINETWGLEVILYGTIMDMGPITSDGLMTVINNAKSIAFEGDMTWHLMKRLEPDYCGVPEHCPFNYRLTARLLAGYVRDFVTAIADKYYRADDVKLQNFMKSVYWWRPNPANTATTKDAVIDYMVEFFMNASYRHDYSHDDFLWHVAKALPPMLMPNPVPERPSSYMPGKDVYGSVLQIAHALQAGVIETPLESYYTVYADDRDLRPAVDKFVAQVQALLVLGGPHEHMNQCGSMTH